MNKVLSRRWIGILLVGGGLALIPLVFWALHEIKREDTPERFAMLCELLLKPMPVENAPVVLVTDAEQTLALQDLQENLRSLGRDCRQLAPIAEESNRQLAAVLQLARTAKGPSKLVLAGIETAVGVSLKSGDMIESGSKDLIQEFKGYIQLWEELKAFRQSLDIQRLKLVQAAPRFSGPATTNSVFTSRFTEESPNLGRRLLGEARSMNGTQTIVLTNASDQDLTRCVVEVRLSDASGKSYQHLYYVGGWAKGERRKVNYSPHELFAETATNVERVQVRLYARELSSFANEFTRKGETWPYTQ